MMSATVAGGGAECWAEASAMIYSPRRSDRTVRYSITPLSPRRRAPPVPVPFACPNEPEATHIERVVTVTLGQHSAGDDLAWCMWARSRRRPDKEAITANLDNYT